MKSVQAFAGAVVVLSLSACSTSGDTGALLLESAESCSVVCTDYPHISAVSYEAGGGSVLLFSGKVAASCVCSDAGR